MTRRHSIDLEVIEGENRCKLNKEGGEAGCARQSEPDVNWSWGKKIMAHGGMERRPVWLMTGE